MLKVIAEDFMQPDAVEILMPMYEELVAATRREPLCISYDLFVDQKDPRHFVLSKPGRIRPRWMPIVPVSTSAAWYPPLINISVPNRVLS